jgi:fructokinase
MTDAGPQDVPIEVLVIGEALVDEVVAPGTAPRTHPGGSPMNVAVGLARLGHAVALLSRWGDDAYGRLLADHVTGNRVALLGDPVDQYATSVAEATLDERGSASYAFDLHWDLPAGAGEAAAALPGLRALHTGSIGAVLPPGAGAVRALVAALRERATVSYDPNCRPALMGDPESTAATVEALVSGADVVKASTDDLAWLYPDRDWVESARAWQRSGPAVVVVTRGGEGAWACCAAGEVDVPPVQVSLVDTVGAGDAFSAGLLGALAERGALGRSPRGSALGAVDLAAVLDRACLVAALTCARAGADPPTRAEVHAAESPPSARGS